MKKLIAAASLVTLSTALAHAQNIEITPNASAPSALGDAKLFSGHVVVDSLFPANEFTHGTGGHVTFAPGARTAWHTHPAGQMLIVTSGKGWVQRRQRKAGDQPRRCRLDPGRREPLARGNRRDRHGPHRDFLHEGRQERRMGQARH